MKLSCVIAAPDVIRPALAMFTGDFEQKLIKSARTGFAGVELMLRDPAVLDPERLRIVLNQNKLQVSQIVTGEVYGSDGLALIHPDPAICVSAMERARAIVRFAGGLGRGTIVNVGRLRGRLDWMPGGRLAARSLAIQAFQALADYAASYGVRITLEPCNRYEVDFVLNARDGLEAVADVGRPNFGLMLDVFHMNIEDPSIEVALREAAPVLWHVHIADSNRLSPGCGHLDFASIVATLRDIGYADFLSVEAQPLPDPDTAARLAMEYMRRFDLSPNIHLGSMTTGFEYGTGVNS